MAWANLMGKFPEVLDRYSSTYVSGTFQANWFRGSGTRTPATCEDGSSGEMARIPVTCKDRLTSDDFSESSSCNSIVNKAMLHILFPVSCSNIL